MDNDIIAAWLSSDEGQAWEEGVYRDAFDEGWENAVATFGYLHIPDDEIPTMDEPFVIAEPMEGYFDGEI